jgi:Flp pilus assembly protein TadD
MCRNLAVAATAFGVALFCAGATRAGVQAPATAQAQAPAQFAAPAPRKKASAQERADAERLSPMARAAFWAREVDVDPTDVVANVRLASALRQLGQYDVAAQTAQKALVVDPKNFDALMETARDYVGQDQGFYAIEPAKRAAAQSPKDWRPLSLLGVAYSQVKRADDAQATWVQALKLSPENPAVLSNMAMSLAVKGDAAGAEALLRRAAARPDAGLQVRQNLTLVLGIEGKLGEAEKLLREDLPPVEAEANLAYLKTMTSGGDAAPAAAARVGETRTWGSLKGAGG